MADTTSIFYKIGQATKSNVGNAITALKADNNTFTGTNDFNKAVSVGTTSANANLTVNGGATITGDLTVQGATTTLSTTNLDVKDNFVRLSKGANAGAFTKDQGFYFERASGSDAGAFIFDESEDSFVIGTLAGTLTPSSVQIGDSTNNVVLEFASGNAYTSLNIVSYTGSGDQTGNHENNFFEESSTELYFYSSSATLADIVTAANNAPITQAAGVANITATLTGNGATSVSNGALSISAETTSAASDSTDDTVNTTPAPLTVGSLKVDATPLGDLDDFNAGLSA